MHLAVLAETGAKEEFLSRGLPAAVSCTFADSVRALEIIEADAYFDLSFQPDPERIKRLHILSNKPLFVNAVAYTGREIRLPAIRFNGWPTFLSRNIMELAITAEKQDRIVKNVFKTLGWNYHIVPDITWFITARIISCIINEAYFTLGDEVSTREEIDIAMKLGTNYPYGPFEWSEKIGLKSVAALLHQLYRDDHLYEIAPALELELMKPERNGKYV